MWSLIWEEQEGGTLVIETTLVSDPDMIDMWSLFWSSQHSAASFLPLQELLSVLVSKGRKEGRQRDDRLGRQ